MIQDASALIDAYKAFIQSALQQEKVWTLVKADEMAIIDSQMYDGELATLFFSNMEAAFLLQKEQWQDFEVAEISLPSFLEKWLVGLYNQDIMVAAIWNDVATGREFEPLELLLEFLETIQEQKIAINFENYYTVEDFLLKIKDTLEE